MKKLLLLLVLIVTLCLVYSQDYDLIVKTNGDSIACHIDSITDTYIYFEMKSNKYWTHTQINKADVSEYKRNAINRKLFVFKSGTSYIESPRQDLPRNSVYAGIASINYSRMIPGERVSVTFAGGLSFVDGVGILAETTLLLGGTKHFFEPGIITYLDTSSVLPLVRIGYRYQGPKGFLFRAAPLFTYLSSDYGFIVVPAISIGYSF